MVTSRALMLGRVVSAGLKAKLGAGHSNQIARNSHTWNYRTGPTNIPKSVVYASQIVGGFMWWWVLWHLWHEPGHVFGEYEYPDVTKWTNAELGIPPDDLDE